MAKVQPQYIKKTVPEIEKNTLSSYLMQRWNQILCTGQPDCSGGIRSVPVFPRDDKELVFNWHRKRKRPFSAAVSIRRIWDIWQWRKPRWRPVSAVMWRGCRHSLRRTNSSGKRHLPTAPAWWS